MEKYRFALIIDGDNVSPKYLRPILDELNKSGEVVIKRIYGDWTENSMNGWKAALQSTPIRTFQQFRYGENATDGSMIMDAIELVASGRHHFNAFAIASSDSDFYSLALRLREHGMFVFGFGRENTKSLFVNSCDRFVYFDKLLATEAAPQANASTRRKIDEMLVRAYQNCDLELHEGWISLSMMGLSLRKAFPDFDPRNHGASTLRDVISRSSKLFEMKNDGRTPPNYWVRSQSAESVQPQVSVQQVLPETVAEVETGGRLTGVVKRWINYFGFIEADGGDYYFRVNEVDIQSRGFRFSVGCKVAFDIKRRPDPLAEDTDLRNGRACNVIPLEMPAQQAESEQWVIA